VLYRVFANFLAKTKKTVPAVVKKEEPKEKPAQMKEDESEGEVVVGLLRLKKKSRRTTLGNLGKVSSSGCRRVMTLLLTRCSSRNTTITSKLSDHRYASNFIPILQIMNIKNLLYLLLLLLERSLHILILLLV
jgi:hypothetical protein